MISKEQPKEDRLTPWMMGGLLFAGSAGMVGLAMNEVINNARLKPAAKCTE